MNNVLDKMLEFENRPEILEFCFSCDKMLMWPFVRWFLLYEGYKEVFGVENAHFQWEKHGLKDLFRYLYLTFFFNPYNSKEADLLFFSSGVVNSFKINGRYFNRVHDYFTFLKRDSSAIIEDSYRRKYRRPRCFPKVGYHDYIGLKAIVMSKLKAVKKQDLSTIEEFVSFTKSHFPIVLQPQIYNNAKAILETMSKKLATLHCCYRKLFNKVKPTIVFLEDASYGMRSYILKWAKDFGITTAEPQHGFVSLNHPAYNFGSEIIVSKEYCRYMPDYFLSFGKYWEKEMRTSSQKVTIGGAHLHSRIQYLREHHRKRTSDNKAILIISDAVNPKCFNRLVGDLAQLIQGKAYRIAFRPHPGEIPIVQVRYGEILDLDNVSIDEDSDVYESMNNADYVVGTFSTVLFEAVGLQKPTFVLQDDISELHMGSNIGVRFKSAEELFAKIVGHRKNSGVDIGDIWEKKWKRNYLDFLSKLKVG